MGLSLVSYSPLDPSLNTATPPQTPPAQNWIGVACAYLADLLLQALGSVAFLLPVLLLARAWLWFRSRAVESPRARVAGVLLLLFSLTSLLGLLTSLNRLWGVIPAGGLLGILLALGLKQLANIHGAFILTITCLVVGAYLVAPFSFSETTSWLGARVGRERPAPAGGWPAAAGWLERLRAISLPWQSWRWPWARARGTATPPPTIVKPGLAAGRAAAVDISAPMQLPAPAAVKAVKVKPQPVPEDEWEDRKSTRL